MSLSYWLIDWLIDWLPFFCILYMKYIHIDIHSTYNGLLSVPSHKWLPGRHNGKISKYHSQPNGTTWSGTMYYPTNQEQYLHILISSISTHTHTHTHTQFTYNMETYIFIYTITTYMYIDIYIQHTNTHTLKHLHIHTSPHI